MKGNEKVRLETWNNYQAGTSWQHFFPLGKKAHGLSFFKLKKKDKSTLLAFHIPGVTQSTSLDYVLLFDQNKILILTDSEREKELLQNHLNQINTEKPEIPSFLYEWLESFSEQEILAIEKAEREITLLEDRILNGTVRNFNSDILDFKKNITRYYHYYHQLVEFANEIKKELETNFSKKETGDFDDYIDRIDRLIDETQFVREYILDVQEVYQAEIEIKQNDTMKFLTIITTIFFPLSLIAGWYGMNFEKMPELKSDYGYPVIIGISICIIIGFLIFFKKKKFF